MKRGLVCVGGPADGRMVLIEEGAAFVIVPDVPEVPLTMPPKPPELTEFQQIIYAPMVVLLTVEGVYEVLVPTDQLPSVTMDRLLRGYGSKVKEIRLREQNEHLKELVRELKAKAAGTWPATPEPKLFPVGSSPRT